MTLAAHHLLGMAALAACGGAQSAAATSESTLDGKPIATVATAQGYPINIAGDGSSVFWTNHLGGQVMALAGGGPPKIVADQQDYPLGIAVDQTDVYWTTLNGGTIQKAPKAGGQPTCENRYRQAHPTRTFVPSKSNRKRTSSSPALAIAARRRQWSSA